MPKNLRKPLLLTYAEAALLAGRDPRTISKAVRLGQIPTVQVGDRHLIPRKILVGRFSGVAEGSKQGGPRD